MCYRHLLAWRHRVSIADRNPPKATFSKVPMYTWAAPELSRVFSCRLKIPNVARVNVSNVYCALHDYVNESHAFTLSSFLGG